MLERGHLSFSGMRNVTPIINLNVLFIIVVILKVTSLHT